MSEGHLEFKNILIEREGERIPKNWGQREEKIHVGKVVLWSRPWNFVVPSEIFFTEEASITLSIAGDKGFRKERTVLGTRTDPWQCRPTREAISPSLPVLRRHRKERIFPSSRGYFPFELFFFPIRPCLRALFPACYCRRRYFGTELRAIAREWVIKRACIRVNELLHPVLDLRCLERCNLFCLAFR